MRNKNKLILSFWVLALLMISFFILNQPQGEASIQQELDEIQRQIDSQEARIAELKRQEENYKKNIEVKRGEVLTLQRELSILEENRKRVLGSIEQTEVEIKKTELEIVNIKLKIAEKEAQTSEEKSKVAETIKSIHWADQKTLLEILLTNESLSDFFNDVKYTEDLQRQIHKSLDKLETIQQGLEVENKNLNQKIENLSELKIALEKKEQELKEEEGMKSRLVIQTKGAEENFQSLLSQVQREWQTANSEISALEKLAKDKIRAQQEVGREFLSGTDLSWPTPGRYITCPFHDPNYPYRSWIGEHSGLDIRAAQGTPLRSAGPGYVARAKDNGMGYSYIMIVHNNELSTVYGHVSRIDVKEDDYVTRGQIIGLSGGMPGTPGAGSFSTGPHLHFEVRLNGIPVNPMNYLK